MHVLLPQLTSKWQALAAAAGWRPAWGAELRAMPPKMLGRCLAASHKVLDRLAFYHEHAGLAACAGAADVTRAGSADARVTGVAAVATADGGAEGVSGREPSMSSLLTMSAAAFEKRFPQFKAWQATHAQRDAEE